MQGCKEDANFKFPPPHPANDELDRTTLWDIELTNGFSTASPLPHPVLKPN